MNERLAIEVVQQALLQTMWLCLPILGILFIVGVAVSLIQTLTSIQEPSFGAVPRLAALFLTFLVALPWLTTSLVTYAGRLFGNLAKYAH